VACDMKSSTGTTGTPSKDERFMNLFCTGRVLAGQYRHRYWHKTRLYQYQSRYEMRYNIGYYRSVLYRQGHHREGFRPRMRMPVQALQLFRPFSMLEQQNATSTVVPTLESISSQTRREKPDDEANTARYYRGRYR
jgi:hypothetical protein